MARANPERRREKINNKKKINPSARHCRPMWKESP